jgi:hypothetical protein
MFPGGGNDLKDDGGVDYRENKDVIFKFIFI